MPLLAGMAIRLCGRPGATNVRDRCGAFEFAATMRQEAYGGYAQAQLSHALGVALWLHDPDAVALHATVAAAGAEVVQAPFDGPFGTTFVFQDLDGYLVTVHDRAARS